MQGAWRPSRACIDYHSLSCDPTGAADKAIDWLLRYFEVAAIGQPGLSRARSLGWTDFEDAAVASAAVSVEAVAIVTRNVKDFGDIRFLYLRRRNIYCRWMTTVRLE